MSRNTKIQVPGARQIFSGLGDFPDSFVILILGTPGSGKTAYCIQFLREGIQAGDHCIYANCSRSLKEEQFNNFFKKTAKSPKFVSLFDGHDTRTQQTTHLSDFLERISSALPEADGGSQTVTRVSVDSITDLLARFSNEEVHKFVTELYDILKERNAAALYTITGTAPSAPSVDMVASLVDGIIQLKSEESGDEVRRSIRLYSLKHIHSNPQWVRINIKPDGNLQFASDSAASGKELVCKLCNGPIIGQAAAAESESSFHPHCLDTYRKLGEIYGPQILYALQPGVANASFFFIDIVGLSNPLLSVENQIRKIEDLNSLIQSCDTYSKVPKDEKIVLPTGDGMAIGFLINPEIPLQLSMQLHTKLRTFNCKVTSDKAIGIRIGLSSGPVFVVSDINNNQNVWGPGIILARRVMDLGDDGHILLADNIAETLMNLKEEYRKTIRLISSGYRIKHGQLLKLYSAHSPDFGNPATPARIELSQ